MRRCRVRSCVTAVLVTCLVTVSPTLVQAVDTSDTRFLASPAITEGKIAFVYADDVWVAGADGTGARRLTSHPGQERNPYFAPDGKHIAFTAVYDGNVDVYVVPVEGGEPKRLTWHPGEDIVRGFTADGKVLFASQRAVFSRRHSQFFTIGVDGGVPQSLPVPSGDMGAISPDGTHLAYTPLGERFRQWKNYRGGTASRIWVLRLTDLSHDEIPKPSGGCNDTQPMWIGETVYFLSDRDGEFNLYSYDPKTRNVVRRTKHDNFPVESASAGAGRIIYEQAGYLNLFDPGTNASTRLKIGVAADLAETRPRYVSKLAFIRSADISPAGKRAVLEYRGEIVTVPAKKGDPRNLTQTPGAHERSPVWSPDGKSIAYFSDAAGEYALHVRPQDGQGEPRVYPLKGAGFYERPVWSPDGKKLAFLDNARTLYWIDLAAGAVKRVAAEPIYSPIETLSASWSPDSRWLAYTLTNKAGFQTIRLYSLEQDRSFPLTDGLAEAGEPVFDAAGKYLFFLASTDAGPVKNWFDQSFTDMPLTLSAYLVTLQRSTPNPLLKESDEEAAEGADKGKEDSKSQKEDSKPQEKGDSSSQKKAEPKGPEKKGSETSKVQNTDSAGKSADSKEDVTPKASKPIVIDLEGIAGRIVSLPIEEGLISGLKPGAEGQIYYIRHTATRPARREEGAGKPSLRRFDLKTREEETLADEVNDFQLSADHKKILYRAGEVAGIVDAGKFHKGDGALAGIGAISIRIEPRAEWAQMFREAWRINRDYFYATNMHGADWNAVRSKYEALLPHLASRGDLDRVIRAMLSELAVGHSNLGGGERLYEPKTVPVGLLGADYEVADGRFRFKTIYGGAYWDPSLRAPLSAPGVDVKPGDFLLAVSGKAINADAEVYRDFEGTVGKRVELKVGPRADGSLARTVIVEPIADEGPLRNRAWVERNLRTVHERTEGRVAYVYVPNTAGAGYAYFKRYFFPQADKAAIIVDERFNGGGQVADYYIELLRRPLVSYWATRHGEPIRTPNAAILGPKVMIIDETAGSGGDLLPWMFRKFRLGPLVGKRTWGGLVGILGFPVLMDGGTVTAPNLAIFTDEGWVVENVGVVPDIEVEQDPAAVAAGKDPQLDRAIETVLEALAKNPPPKAPIRPSFPVRVRAGSDVRAR
jgi:tricorn protease